MFPSHAINRLCIHNISNKTSYELITGNKPKISHFRLFGCKCFILNKRPKPFKLAPKVDEGFLLGHGSNEHAYHVFNKASPKVGITIDVRFDETNGSQVEQVGLRIVDNDKPSCEAVK
jgi:hypothetical protein